MLRCLLGNALRAASCLSRIEPMLQPAGQRALSTVVNNASTRQRLILSNLKVSITNQLLHGQMCASRPAILPVPLQQQPARSLTKFSLNKGKRKSVKAVIKRFKRLDWGIWIRTHCGRHKKLFKKSPALRRRLRQHIFTNSTQSWLLDKMVTSFWRRPKYYIDDPYEPYHKREEFFATKSKTFKV